MVHDSARSAPTPRSHAGLLGLPLAALLLCAAGAQAQFSSGFEAPTFAGSASGTSINGQDMWFTPAVAGSVDGFVFTYEGNSLGLPANPDGGDQFLAGVSGGGSAFSRSQREGITFPTIAVITYDILGAYSGTGASAQNLGSFSLQPEPNSAAPAIRSYIQLDVWVDPNNPTNWNANYLPYDANNMQFAQPGMNGGAAWQNLSLNTWYRLSTTIDLTQNRITEISITNLSTGDTATNAPEGWYLGGGANSTLANPSGVRFFAGGGLGNTMAWDNFSIAPPAAPCPCNWNMDDTLNSQDFFDFLTDFFAGDADYNHDQTTNSQDFFDFLTCFFAGCE